MSMLDLAIRKRLGDFSLDVSFAVPEQGLTALFGRSGAGKTSVIAAIAGLLQPDEGHIRVAGRTLFDSAAGRDEPVHRRRVGYVFQEGRLFPHLSVRDNLLYGHRRSPAADRRITLEEMVELLGVGALLARRPRDLSGGEKQRVAIGRALLAQPEVLLMDEPLAALDAPRKREILPYLERLRDELRVPIVYVSHAIEEVVRLANQVVVLDAGRVVATGTPEQLGERLDLRPLLGEFESGAVIDASMESYDSGFDLSTLVFEGGKLRVPGNAGASGARVRVRVRARDISLATEKPLSISVQNIFEGGVEQIAEEPGAYAELKLRVGNTRFLSRVTRESVSRLGIATGGRVFLLVKSVSFDRETLSAAPGIASTGRPEVD
jgi:molybdate transport system ATP-binding protein